MTRKHRNHSPEFKAKVALDATKGDKTVTELAQKYNLQANQISTWKKELLESATMILPPKITQENRVTKKWTNFTPRSVN